MAIDASERERLIAQYRDGYRAVSEALLRITDEELDARSGPGRWSAREIVHHLADSEMNAAMRLRLLLAEDRPAIRAIDQDEFARRLHYDRPYQSSLEAFRWAREATAELLERLTPEEWLREGTHSEVGRFGVQAWLEIYAPHAHRHATQIREARSAAVNQ
jgi:DinB superfamily